MFGSHIYYRPQRSCGQGYVFKRVCDSVNRGGGVSGQNPPAARTPPGPGRPPPGEPPRPGRPPPRTRQTTPPGPGRPPCRENPPGPGRPPPRTRQTAPPDQADPLPREEDCSIWSMSGRYASYWNAFLFTLHYNLFVEAKKP